MNSELQKHPQEIHKDRFQVLTKLAKGLLGVLISVCYLVRTVQKALLIKIDLNLRWFYGDRPRIEKTYSSELFTTMALFSFINHKYNIFSRCACLNFTRVNDSGTTHVVSTFGEHHSLVNNSHDSN